MSNNCSNFATEFTYCCVRLQGIFATFRECLAAVNGDFMRSRDPDDTHNHNYS